MNIPKLEMDSIEKTLQEDEEKKILYEKYMYEQMQKQKYKNNNNDNPHLKIEDNMLEKNIENRNKINAKHPKSDNIKIEEVDLGSEFIDLNKDDNYFEVNFIDDKDKNGQGSFNYLFFNI